MTRLLGMLLLGARLFALPAAFFVSFQIPTADAAVGPSELWKINADGTGLARFADTPGYTSGSPEWSPDSRFVAYGAWHNNEQLQDEHIFVIRADGTHSTDLGPGAMPNWSPDSSQLVFHTYATSGGSDHVVVMNADGTGRENILDHWGCPRWSRRGDALFTILGSNIGLFDLPTGKERHRFQLHAAR
jgi:Tol biopolymer transport system component